MSGTLDELDIRWRKFRRHLKHHLGVLDPLRLDVYRGFASEDRAVLRGRALENELPARPDTDDGAFANLRRSLRLFESDEVAGVQLTVKFAGVSCDTVTDSEGYFDVELPMTHALPPGWHPIVVEVRGDDFAQSCGVLGRGQVLVPVPSARFGVISDIDDTILRSHVQNRVRQAYVTLLGNSISRLSYPGTPELYQGLKRASEAGPFFYVSRSAWNVHAVLEAFIERQGFPVGPLLLRDIELLSEHSSSAPHKPNEIERILRMYPDTPFVLIGDSGQSDPDTYATLARQHPGRIKSILLRNVSSDRRCRRIDRHLRQQCPAGCDHLLFDSADAARDFCRARGLWR